MIQLQAILKDKGSLEDGTRKIQLYCQETSPEQLLEVLKLDGKIGWFVFSEGMIQEKDIPEEEIEYRGDKTPGQRLRGVIFKNWELNTNKKEEFSTYYKRHMESLIQLYKEKLNG